MRPRPRALRACEQAVTEVVGYVLMFFLSSAVLILSLQAFLQSRDSTTDLAMASEVRLLADRVAQEVLQAGIAAQDLPNATYEGVVRLPTLGGLAYRVNASGDRVWVNSTDGRFAANATVFQVQTVVDHVHGTVFGAQQSLKVVYQKASGWSTIRLTV